MQQKAAIFLACLTIVAVAEWSMEHATRNMAAIHRPFVRSASRKLHQMLNVTMTTILALHWEKWVSDTRPLKRKSNEKYSKIKLF